MASPFTWTFTTAPSSSKAPTVTGETPSSGATNVAVSSTATATFNQAVQASTISFTLTPKGGSPVAATLTYNTSNYTATLTSNSALAYNTTYTATVSGAQNTSGVPMTSPFTWSFTTTAPSSGTPTVTGESPVAGATSVTVSSPVTVTFSEAVQASTINFKLSDSSGNVLPASISYNSATYTATLTPATQWAYWTTYTATVSGAENSSGVAMTAPVTWSFTTDPAPPEVTVESPASGATAALVSSPITAAFNEAVQASTISFTLTNSSGSSVAGTVTYNSSNDTATLTPGSALAYATTYTATVSGAKDTVGDSMPVPFTWMFTTAAGPAVSSESPAPGATVIAASAPVTATFDQPVQASTISFTLKNTSGSTVPATVSYNSSTNVATLTPSAALAYNTTYTATVSGAQNSSGVAMSSAFAWSFTTASSGAPIVTSETPASGTINVPPASALTATFNEAVQASTISFSLVNPAGTSVPGTVSYNTATYTATFTPTASLAMDTVFTAKVSGAQSNSGVPMTTPASWSFTSDPVPIITAEYPAAGEGGTRFFVDMGDLASDGDV